MMNLDALTLRHFRNYHEQAIAFSPGVNILLGENAQGKTNVLEAIHCLAVGKSHRSNRDADLVEWGAEAASIRARVTSAHATRRELRIDYQPGSKRAFINGVQQTKMTDYIGHFQVVLFAPEDLQLVKGAPALRRRFLDMELSQTQPKYLFHLSRYTRSLQQRNALLRGQQAVDTTFLDAIDEQLVEHGTEVYARRAHFVSRLRGYAKAIHETISDGRDELDVSYTCGLTVNGEQWLEKSVIANAFTAALGRKRASDMHQGYTSVGPHRDDLSLMIGGQAVASFASQGQQRTIALSLRLAEMDFIYEEVGEYPVLLLDDVLSELDDIRQKNLVLSMSQKVQTVLTTTSLFHLEQDLHGCAKLFHVQSGIIQMED